MCAGITVFNAIYISNVRPTGRIGVVGIGGLGHLALQFARAWGCHVTAISGSADKKEEALGFGAHDFLVSRNLKIEDVKAEDKFDLILDTVSASLDWDLYISLLKRNGAMYLMGFPDKPMEIKNAANLITAQASLRGAINGGRYLTELMLDFADRHNIKPMVEEYPFSVQGIEESMEVCGKSKARYRGVLVAKE
jgi:uncharacterized zinc-type alcohol dehydrogenase-like protein